MKNKTFFISDIHLGSLLHDNMLAVEQKLVRWLYSIKNEAKTIYFVGDVFDYWFEYKTVVPKGFTRFLGTLALMNDEGCDIHFFVGNHDVWMKDYLTKEIGATIHHHTEIISINNKRFRISHGDEEYSHHSWQEKFLYKLFRNKVCQALYGAIHPRWTVGLALYCSQQSRKRHLKKKQQGKIPHAYENEYFDIDNHYIVQYTKKLIIEDASIDYYIYGHIHLLIDLALKNDKRLIILGDWLKYFSYACFDGKNLFIDQFIEE